MGSKVGLVGWAQIPEWIRAVTRTFAAFLYKRVVLMRFRNWMIGLLPFGLMGCSDGNRMAEAAFQYRVDSTVNARLDSVQSSLQHRNDSIIRQAAQLRADSLRLASGRPPAPRPRTDTSRPPAVVIPEPSEP